MRKGSEASKPKNFETLFLFKFQFWYTFVSFPFSWHVACQGNVHGDFHDAEETAKKDLARIQSMLFPEGLLAADWFDARRTVSHAAGLRECRVALSTHDRVDERKPVGQCTGTIGSVVGHLGKRARRSGKKIRRSG